ncbi:DUF3131 domain-containing protein [Actibacterium pelagium]|uniref:DUF3131 domain-containing protein n=1 Tax=Actibacterium pelagium TaxID=2029103 RepID=A0A917EKL9_9RHOB|nr:DUF3131 domain-containing protein [Actibacterium pelagium]GGE54181.1 hypothetical protein GCM10011517_22230 [Actibacterium pelagium]
MPFKLSESRSGLVFMTGLLVAAGASVGLDQGGRLLSQAQTLASLQSAKEELAVAPRRALTPDDLTAATIAWTYIQANTRPETGLVDSVAGFPSTTLWDQGSYVLAMLSAYRIGLINRAELDFRLEQFLNTFERLPLFDGKLPNKVYHTETLAMVDYQNNAVEDGIGWSALDVARILSALRAVERIEPKYGPQIRQLLGRWQLDAMTKGGQLVGALKEGDEVTYPQEGRIGYEQYAARASALWGLDVLGVISARPVLKWEDVLEVQVPVDKRDHSIFRAITPILSEPFILQGLELGLDSETALLASRVYRAQEARYLATGTLTMVSEDHVDQDPYFLYSAVHSNGDAWAVVNENGKRYDELRTLSVKSIFAWDALYQTEYTALLRTHINDLGDPEKGWPAGIYETSGAVNEAYSLNTNAIVLEAIHNIAFGPLWQS